MLVVLYIWLFIGQKMFMTYKKSFWTCPKTFSIYPKTLLIFNFQHFSCSVVEIDFQNIHPR
jgi:hypothetical protein